MIGPIVIGAALLYLLISIVVVRCHCLRGINDSDPI